MPYKHSKPGVLIPRDKRKTVKLPESEHENVRLHYLHSKSQRKTAAHFGVSRRLITLIVDSGKLKRHKELAKERQKDGRYYDKEKHREYMRTHRHRKQELMKQGELIIN